MTRLEALIGLNMVLDIGSVRLGGLLDYFDKPENIIKASPQKLMAVSGVGGKIAAKISALGKEQLEREFALIKEHSLRIITYEDKDYPENLRNIPGPPIVLYVRGELKKQDKFSIAIVGSRRASLYGLHSAEKFSAQLSGLGLTIVSGMARGIDTYAHRGALKQGNRTIAVLGSGFSQVYPPENKGLLEEIAASGLVISEFPCETRPLKQNFPRRNRVISGMSLAVLVVEAARNSGALITADFALEQGRDVFALPGEIDSYTSFGTNGLIKQGAKLVSCVNDILEELNAVSSEYISEKLEENSLKEARQENAALSSEESFLYNLISNQPVLLDDIVERSDMGVSAVSDTLLRLQFKKMIRQLPGKQFIRSQ